MTTMTARSFFRFGRSILLAILVAALVGFGLLRANDAAWERWPQQTDLATLWGMEIFRIGPAERRFGGALATRGGEGLMRFMLATGFDPDRSSEGVTPLTLALDLPPGAAVSVEKLAILLDGGADPDRVDGSGSRPLILAIENATARHVRLLLEHGAGPDAVDGRGRSALDHLADREPVDREMVAALLAFGSDPCSEVQRPTGTADLSAWLAERSLADLAERAATACRAKRAAK